MVPILLAYAVLILVIVFVINRLTCGIAKTSACLLGKTAIVTGGNAGIGYEIVLNLASRGCRVIIADRDNAEESRKKIITETGNPNVVVKHLNLASFKSIRQFAEDIHKTESGIDILVNNAGVPLCQPLVTEDGLNGVFQVNHYGPFLLTHLLLDLLKKSSPSRIIFTSSAYSAFFNLSLDDINPINYEVSQFFRHHRVYANSKLCAIMMANEFAEKLKGTGITSNSLHPGCVRTKLLHKAIVRDVWHMNLNLLMWNIMIHLAGKSAWEGSQTAVHVATSKDLESVSGKYFMDCMIFPFLPTEARDSKFREMLWKRSEELTKLTENETLKVVLEEKKF